MTGGNPEIRSLSAMLFAPLLLSMTLAACSSSSENTFTFFAAPGAYEYHNCEQLAAAVKATTLRQKDLKALIDKAAQGTAGAFVGTIAYKSDYLAATENLKLLDIAVREKNCLTSETWRSNTVIQ